MRNALPMATLAALLLSASIASAQSGTVSSDRVRAFVDEVAAPTPSGQLARWDQAVCTRVTGMPASQAQYLADAIARRALAVGLVPGGPGCAPNIRIFVTQDSDALSRELVQSQPAAFNAGNFNNRVVVSPELSAFVDTPRAVRWWSVAQTASNDGVLMNDQQVYGGTMQHAPSLNFYNATRLYQSTQQNLVNSIVIVDARRVSGTRLATLADYLSMVTLAQVNPGANVGSESILSLFSQQENAPRAMTAWDVAYLDGLYRAPRDAHSASEQESSITRRMTQILAQQH